MKSDFSARAKRTGLPAATPLIVGFVCYQFLLCFVNTNIFPVSNAIVAGVEIFLLACTALRVFSSCRFNEIALALFLLVYFMLLWAVRGEVDFEAPRNIFIILLSFALGRAMPDRQAANKLVWLISGIVVVFAAAEYFLTDLYLRFFDILHYYIARGLVSEQVQSWVQQNYFVSGFRPSGRNILPFLGDQRISSVFMEPVSMGNYAIILCVWGLSFDSKEKKAALKHIAMAAVFIVACDSRFASLLVFVLLAMRFIPVMQRRGVLLAMPVLAVGGLAAFTLLRLEDSAQDNLFGRLMRSGELMLGMSFSQLMGAGIPDLLGDEGVAYTTEHFGIFLCIGLWLVFVSSPLADAQARRFRLMLAFYALGILMISGTSFYSSKTSVILWFLYGVLVGAPKPDAVDKKATEEKWQIRA